MPILRRIFLQILPLGFMALVLCGSTATAQTAGSSQQAPKKGQNQDQVIAQFHARCMAWFKKADINNDGFLDSAEITNSLGTGARASDFRKKDTDADGKVSRDEFEAWVTEYAPKYAQELAKEQQDQEQELKKLQQQQAQANGQAKQRLQNQVNQQRQRIDQQRRQDNVEQRLRQQLARQRQQQRR